MEIKNTNALAMNIGILDYAREQPMFLEDAVPMAQVVSKGYKIIQHNDVLQAVTEALATKNIQVSGRLDNFRDSFRADLIFENQGTPVKDDATGLKIGIRVLNSYNKSSSFRLELFAFRMVCQNGMSLGQVMNGIRELTFHTGELKPLQKIKEITEGFLIDAINSSEKLQTFVNASMIDSLAHTQAMDKQWKL